ncbi:MAG: hypothetical protein ACI9FB_002994 [Candidatus Azotimanducaceae bacterium]|jgi:hypothetical protein
MPGNAAIDEVAGLGKIAGNSKVKAFGAKLYRRMVNADLTGKDIVKIPKHKILSYIKISIPLGCLPASFASDRVYAGKYNVVFKRAGKFYLDRRVRTAEILLTDPIT